MAVGTLEALKDKMRDEELEPPRVRRVTRQEEVEEE